MTRDELIQWVKADITVGGQLAINIPDSEIERVLDQSIAEVYEKYPDSLQESFIIIHNGVFRHPEFRKNRTLQFPDCVRAVIRFEEMNRRNGVFGFGDREMCVEKMFMADAFYGGYGLVNSDVLAARTISYSSFDQLKSFSLCAIQYDFNRNTHRLLVKGHDPRTNVVCTMMTGIPERDLYADPWVRRYVAAKCRLQVYRLLGTFSTTLLGGNTTINAAMYKETADTELTECNDYFKNLTVNSTFLIDYY